MNQFVRQRFHIVRTSPRVDFLTDLCFFLDINLSVTSDTCREVCRQSDRFVQCVRVQRLRVPQSGSHSFNTSTANVVERILFGQRPTRSLAVSTQSQRFRVLGTEALHDLRPQHTCSTHLGDFHEMVHTDRPEEGQTRSESIDIDTCIHTGTKIFKTVAKRISHFDIGRRTCFLHVVTGDGDGVELRHLLRSVFEDIGNDTHGEFRRVDISVTHHEFFQDIVLDRTGHLFQLGALFQTGIDIECQYRKYGTVHCHGYRHLIQRNTIEQNFHVFQRTDRNTGFTDITYHTFVVGIITTVRRKVESDRQTFLAGSQVTTVECVGLFSS